MLGHEEGVFLTLQNLTVTGETDTQIDDLRTVVRAAMSVSIGCRGKSRKVC